VDEENVKSQREAVRYEKMHLAALQRRILAAKGHLLGLDPEEEREAIRGERMHILVLQKQMWAAEAALKILEEKLVIRTTIDLDKLLVP